MAVARYSAQRSLVGGVSVDDTVTFQIKTREPFNRSRQVNRFTSRSLDGTPETTYYRGDVAWPVQTIILYAAAALELVQFLDSVEDGQVFEFSPYEDDPITAADYRNVLCTSGGYTEKREVSTGTPANDGLSYQFSVVEVP